VCVLREPNPSVLKMEAVCWFETSVSTYSTTQCQNQKPKWIFPTVKIRIFTVYWSHFWIQRWHFRQLWPWAAGTTQAVPWRIGRRSRDVRDDMIDVIILHLLSQNLNSVTAENNVPFKLVSIACNLTDTLDKELYCSERAEHSYEWL
jgi:hypothetical protein